VYDDELSENEEFQEEDSVEEGDDDNDEDNESQGYDEEYEEVERPRKGKQSQPKVGEELEEIERTVEQKSVEGISAAKKKLVPSATPSPVKKEQPDKHQATSAENSATTSPKKHSPAKKHPPKKHPPKPKELTEEEKEAQRVQWDKLQTEFLDFSNWRLLPGPSARRDDLVKSFRAHFCETYMTEEDLPTQDIEKLIDDWYDRKVRLNTTGGVYEGIVLNPKWLEDGSASTPILANMSSTAVTSGGVKPKKASKKKDKKSSSSTATQDTTPEVTDEENSSSGLVEKKEKKIKKDKKSKKGDYGGIVVAENDVGHATEKKQKKVTANNAEKGKKEKTKNSEEKGDQESG
jgi:hypothetical protein